MAQILDDADTDALIARLARPLAAADRQAFDTAPSREQSRVLSRASPATEHRV